MSLELPAYLQDESIAVIHNRMLLEVDADLSREEGSIIWDATRPAAVLLRRANFNTREALRRGFVGTSAENGTYGPYLDLRAAEHGLTRLAPTPAKGTVRFAGTNGTVVPAGTQVSTRSTFTVPAQVYATDAPGTITGGILDVAVTALTPGTGGNVAAGAVVSLVGSVTGVTSVTNLAAFTGGTDTETDDALRARFLVKVRNPSAGGNVADYLNWALEVPGVGGAAVVPVRDGPGTVSLAIIGTDKLPAPKLLVDTVQDHIARPYRASVESETLTLSGFGASVDATQSDDTGDSVLMQHNASGNGQITHTTVHTQFQGKRGNWRAHPVVKVDAATGSTPFLRIEFWNNTLGVLAKTRESGGVDARTDYTGAQLSTTFRELSQDVWWNGSDSLEFRVIRLTADAVRQVHVDQHRYQSMFPVDGSEPLAPVGAAVRVESAVPVPVVVNADIYVKPGHNASVVLAAVTTAVNDYIKSVALQEDNDIRFARVANAVLDTAGVEDYDPATLTVNGAEVNVIVPPQSVAVPGAHDIQQAV